MAVTKIISGGQTGADRGALDAAMDLGLHHGGWCPRGRRAEDGRIPDRYQLMEHKSAEYPPRTEANVLEADGTVIFYIRRPSRGTGLASAVARKYGRPAFSVDLGRSPEHQISKLRKWLAQHEIRVLNVAGPRASRGLTIGEDVRRFLVAALRKEG